MNWKMNATLELISKYENFSPDSDKYQVIIAPSHPYIMQSKLKLGNKFSICAQDISEHEGGAYTGSVSAKMIKECGCGYVIIGHSETRSGSTDEILRQKVRLSLNNNLKVIYCIGENTDIKSLGRSECIKYLANQIREIAQTTDAQITSDNLMIAYEPIWAIGTGDAATIANIDAISSELSGILTRANLNPKVLYGGSVNPSNALEILQINAISGLLIGGMGLKTELLRCFC